MKILFIILEILLAYCLGSISGAILICKILHLTDPRRSGSKNPGATNIFRIAGYKLACSVALFDFLKGAIPVYIGLYCNITPIELQIIIIFVCVGHMYPIFFKFCGGKGVATAFGTLTAINLHFFAIILTTWVSIIIIFRYVSLGSIITAVIIPACAWFIEPQYLNCIILLSTLILIRHSNNIKRLYYNEEQQI